ncbi:MAG: hypothetical protein AAGM22_14455 [Acidobacteriota bacterium]
MAESIARKRFKQAFGKLWADENVDRDLTDGLPCYRNTDPSTARTLSSAKETLPDGEEVHWWDHSDSITFD